MYKPNLVPYCFQKWCDNPNPDPEFQSGIRLFWIWILFAPFCAPTDRPALLHFLLVVRMHSHATCFKKRRKWRRAGLSVGAMNVNFISQLKGHITENQTRVIMTLKRESSTFLQNDYPWLLWGGSHLCLTPPWLPLWLWFDFQWWLSAKILTLLF